MSESTIFLRTLVNSTTLVQVEFCGDTVLREDIDMLIKNLDVARESWPSRTEVRFKRATYPGYEG